MNYYEILSQHAGEVELAPSETSYFSVPGAGLDPRLFRSGKLLAPVRAGILTLLYNHLKLGYNEPESWTNIWLAGSGVSYNWAADRDPADLDCLVGVNYIQFRQSNQEYKGWSDSEIAAEINQGFRNELQPRTDRFMDSFELTFYVNVNPDIRKLNPYAAYSVLNDAWVVPPSKDEAPVNPDWDAAVDRDRTLATEIIKRYASATEQIKMAANSAMRINAETALAHAVQQGSALFEDIHESRGAAFSQGGAGYYDFANYRWQAGKKHGVVSAMKQLKAIQKEASERFSQETYGVELPDVSTLIRRSVRR
jgi:hypothetical protein